MTTASAKSAWKHWIQAGIIILVLTLLDQVSKHLVLTYLKGENDISLISGVLQLRYIENRGMAFGLFEGKIPVFVILCLLFFCLFVYVYARIPRTRYYLPLAVTSVIMVSGALGNFIDRVFRGYVVDFIYFSLMYFVIFLYLVFYFKIVFFFYIFFVFFFFFFL